jgi:hypothetical protein
MQANEQQAKRNISMNHVGPGALNALGVIDTVLRLRAEAGNTKFRESLMLSALKHDVRPALAALMNAAKAVHELADAVIDAEGSDAGYGLRLMSDVYAAHGSCTPARWYVTPNEEWWTEDDARRGLDAMRQNALARLWGALESCGAA